MNQRSTLFDTLVTAGLLGVELTFIVNAYFLARHFDRYKYERLDGWLYIVKSFLKIIPVYWLALIVYWISLKISTGSCPLGYLNIFSHFFFLNALNPHWWSDFMGGSGYFGVIGLMWIIFPLYMKVARNLRSALILCVVVIWGSSFLEDLIRQINEQVKLYDVQDVHVWTWYLKRGFDCYAIGIVLFYVSKLRLSIFETHKKFKQVLIYMVLSYIAYKCATKGGGFDGVRFSILSSVVLLLSLKEKIKIIDNPIFVFLGKNITELFVLHVILYYIFVDHHKILASDTVAFFILFVLSLLLAPIFKKNISEPLGKFLCDRYSLFLSRYVKKLVFNGS